MTIKANPYNLIILSFLVGMVSINGCQRQPGKGAVEKPPDPERDPAVVTVQGSQTIHRDDQGRPVWKIKAKSLKADEQNSMMEVTGGEVTVYDKGTLALRFESRRVTADARNRLLTAVGGIAVQSSFNDTKFRSDRMTVNLKTSRIVASGEISGSNYAGAFKADKLETDLRFQNVRVTAEDKVRATISLPEQRRKKL